MNRLCRELEKWEKTFRFKRTFRDFNYHIMIDSSIPVDEDKLAKIDAIYHEFSREVRQLADDQRAIRAEGIAFKINWGYYYEIFREKCREVCPNEKELANYAVTICYSRNPKKSKQFMWRVAEQGILENIQQVPIHLPIRDDAGRFEYLGKRYSLVLMHEEEKTVD